MNIILCAAMVAVSLGTIGPAYAGGGAVANTRVTEVPGVRQPVRVQVVEHQPESQASGSGAQRAQPPPSGSIRPGSGAG